MQVLRNWYEFNLDNIINSSDSRYKAIKKTWKKNVYGMKDNLYRRNLVANSIIKLLSIERSISIEAAANDLDDELV